MKNGLLAILCVGALASLSALTGCQTLSETPGENANTIVRGTNTNGSEMVEDTQNLLFLNHPSFNSKKPIPNN